MRSQFSRTVCLTLCDPMDCSKPGLPVHHQLPEFAQTHVHQVGDATQPSHPLSSPSPFSSYPQSLPASGSFPMSQFLASGAPSTGVPASAPVLMIYRDTLCLPFLLMFSPQVLPLCTYAPSLNGRLLLNLRLLLEFTFFALFRECCFSTWFWCQVNLNLYTVP